MNATVCSINPPGHDWENGLVCRWCQETRTPEDAVLSQLASRRGGNPAAARALLDAYRAEVLAADGQAYDGELAALRRRLHQHALDDIAARAGDIEKTGAEAATATPANPSTGAAS
jgi:hypothetical protein